MFLLGVLVAETSIDRPRASPFFGNGETPQKELPTDAVPITTWGTIGWVS